MAATNGLPGPGGHGLQGLIEIRGSKGVLAPWRGRFRAVEAVCS